MEENSRVYGVLLTEDAWDDLTNALEPYTSHGPIGKYIYCRDVDPHGNYFVMVAKCENPDGSMFDAEISLPHHYIRCCVSALDERQIGFIQK